MQVKRLRRPRCRRAPAQSNADRLNDLKTIREYQAKRRQILDRV
jgi:hypothetical protein